MALKVAPFEHERFRMEHSLMNIERSLTNIEHFIANIEHSLVNVECSVLNREHLQQHAMLLTYWYIVWLYVLMNYDRFVMVQVLHCITAALLLSC